MMPVQIFFRSTGLASESISMQNGISPNAIFIGIRGSPFAATCPLIITRAFSRFTHAFSRTKFWGLLFFDKIISTIFTLQIDWAFISRIFYSGSIFKFFSKKNRETFSRTIFLWRRSPIIKNNMTNRAGFINMPHASPKPWLLKYTTAFSATEFRFITGGSFK